MVKCADCGYLAQHIYRGSIPQGFIDVEESSRETGDLPTLARYISYKPDLGPDKLGGDYFPMCFSHVFNLGQEVKDQIAKVSKTESPVSVVKDVIQKERACEQFVKWIRGFTPKEHMEMVDREWMQKHLEEREDAARKWREEQEDKDRTWRAEQEKKRSKDEWIRIVILALATIIAGVIGYFLPHP
jgi:hypothetical protein